MNWNRAKTILIVFLIMTSCLLGYMLINSNSEHGKIRSETIAYTAKLLGERGISVDSSLISDEIKSVSLYEAENVVSDYNEFALKCFSDAKQAQEGYFTSSSGTLSFDGDDFYIHYNVGIDTDNKLKSPSEKAKKYLLSLGIDTNNASVHTSNNGKGVFTVTFTNALDGMSFFDSCIAVSLDGNKIVSASGSWFKKTDILSSSVQLDSVPGLLIKFSSENKVFSNLEISHIELGYAVNEKGVFHKQSTILPVYRITSTDGKVFTIDAREAR